MSLVRRGRSQEKFRSPKTIGLRMRISRFKNEQYIPQLFTRNFDPVP